MIQSVTVLNYFISLTCGVATVKVKGQGHLKMKVKVTKNYEKSQFFLNFYAKFFDPWCLFGVMSQF